MIHPTLLIFSSSEDQHIKAVIPHLSPQTIPLVCDLSSFGFDFAATVISGPLFSLRIHDALGRAFSLDRVETVWWRRPQPFVLNTTFDEAVARYVQHENLAFWGGALSLIPESVRWYNHFHAHRLADRKLKQLDVAQKCGLKIPNTCVTSSPEEAQAFIERHRKVAFKSFSGSEQVWRPTRTFTAEMMPSLASLPVCPVIFQEYVEGIEDLRVTIIDQHLEAVSFDLTNSRYPSDVRMDTKIPCVRTHIPDEVSEKLLRFLNNMGLRFGAFDLRRDANGQCFFFEINPAGQFLYLDRLAGTNLAKAMANALSSESDDGGPFQTVCTADTPALDFAAAAPFALSTPSIEKHLE